MLTDKEMLTYARSLIRKGQRPLYLSGDAFRLLADLKLDVRFETEARGAVVVVGPEWHQRAVDFRCVELLVDAPEVAIRRALTRTAATLGLEWQGKTRMR